MTSPQNARKSRAATGATTIRKTAAPRSRPHARADPAPARRRASPSVRAPDRCASRNGANGQASCLVAQARPSRAAAASGARRAREVHGAQQERGHEDVVGPEDLLPVHERAHPYRGRGAKGERGRRSEPVGEDPRRREREQRDQARIEHADGRARQRHERHHQEMRAGQVGMVTEDRVAAVLGPEVGDARLAAEHAVRVVRAVRALAGQDVIDRERQLDDAAVLSVGSSGDRSHRDERGRGQRRPARTAATASTAIRSARTRAGQGQRRDRRRRGRRPARPGRARWDHDRDRRTDAAGAGPARPRARPARRRGGAARRGCAADRRRRDAARSGGEGRERRRRRREDAAAGRPAISRPRGAA